MGTLITIITVIACVLLILVILIQNPKGGGLASGFSSANQIGGIRRTTDFLEKSTWTLLVAILAFSVFSTSFSRTNVVATEAPQEGIEDLVGNSASAPALQDIPTQNIDIEETPANTEESEDNK